MKLSDELATARDVYGEHLGINRCPPERMWNRWAWRAADLEKELAVCKRAWELHDAEFSSPSPIVSYNSSHYERLAREETKDVRPDEAE